MGCVPEGRLRQRRLSGQSVGSVTVFGRVAVGGLIDSDGFMSSDRIEWQR